MVEQLWGDQDDIATLHEIAALLRQGDAEAVDILAGKVDSLRKRMTAQRLEGASLERGASNGPAGIVQA